MKQIPSWLIATGFVSSGLVWAGLSASGCAGGEEVATDLGSGGGSSGPGGGCVPEPKELCNGVDDTCDEAVDEGCACVEGDTEPCFGGDAALVGVGACAEGQRTCDAMGAFGECEGEVLPSDEQCNGADDDCDGATDEDISSVTCGDGICQATVEACVGGIRVDCVPGQPNPTEACDGADDDCDGSVDEGCTCLDGATQDCYSGNPATQNVGTCKDGTQTCAGGQWGACRGDVTPVAEECDGLDNDCDGSEDDGDPEGGSACSTGAPGKCAAGVQHCSGGQLQCQQTNQPSAETCNGIDDDCDGTTDDGNPGGGAVCNSGKPGVCAPGTMKCVGGALSCVQNVQPSAEGCDGQDNDCDGAVDENNPGGGGSCSTGQLGVCNPGTLTCSNGAVQCLQNMQPGAEVCNAADDDCNGVIDNGNNACGGACNLQNAPGSTCDGGDSDLCTEGSWQCSGINTVACSDMTGNNAEICDAIDQDCDGNISEGPCSLPNASSTCNGGTCIISGCNGGYANCDASTLNGCETQNSGWSNSAPGEGLGTWDADALSGFGCPGQGCDYLLQKTGTRGRYFTIGAHEGSNCCAYVSLKFELLVPVGVDYDLYVTGNSCFADPAFQQTGNGNKIITVWCNDDCGGGDNSFTANVEVRYASGSSCSAWTLNVYRNQC